MASGYSLTLKGFKEGLRNKEAHLRAPEISEVGCVLYLLLNRVEVGIVKDLSGQGNHGKVYGAVLKKIGEEYYLKWKGDLIKIGGKALSFDGSGDYVDCGNDASLDITGAITVEAWIKVNSAGLSGHRRILSKREGSESWGYILSMTDGEPKFFIGNGSGNVAAAAGMTLEADKWYHIVGNWDGVDTNRIFINGTEKGSNTVTSLASSPHNVYIGSDTDGNYCFNGIISEVRIYNRALSEKEIRKHYELMKDLFK